MVYPRVAGGASLLISLPLMSKTTLIIGDGALAAARATAALQADSNVVVFATSAPSEIASEEIKIRGERGELMVMEGSLEDVLEQYGANIALAFITDTLIGAPRRRDLASAIALRNALKQWGILVNVADIPSLCDFTLPACHRFALASSPSSSTPSSLQVAVTTNGKGCRLAGRIRREIVSRLPECIGQAVENVSRLREMAKSLPEDVTDHLQSVVITPQLHEDSLPITPNEPVEQDIGHQGESVSSESAEDMQKRRMRWVAQISEYWPLEHLAKLDATQSEDILRRCYHSDESHHPQEFTSRHKNNDDLPVHATDIPQDPPSRHDLVLMPTKPLGQIYLLGSGPGHPDLLTVAAHTILTRKATLVLSDKLVPSEVLALIPTTTTIKIAKKFPGNNEGAQNELMVEAVEAAKRGKIVVRVRESISANQG